MDVAGDVGAAGADDMRFLKGQMIKIQIAAKKNGLPVVTVNPEEVQYINHIPTCPQCKGVESVVIFNVTGRVYECGGCSLRFRLPPRARLSFWKPA
jgi:hypothetical protein